MNMDKVYRNAISRKASNRASFPSQYMADYRYSTIGQKKVIKGMNPSPNVIPVLKYLQKKNVTQFLTPSMKAARNELNGVLGSKYFTPETITAYNAKKEITHNNLSKEEVSSLSPREYLKNPRAKNFMVTGLGPEKLISKRNSMRRFLNDKLMNDVEQQTDKTYKLKENMLDSEENTFVLKGDTFTIAPNSNSSKFVHPMLLGGWEDVDSAGTFIIHEKYITVTADSGHYKPDSTHIDIAHQKLALFFEDTKRHHMRGEWPNVHKNVRHKK